MSDGGQSRRAWLRGGFLRGLAEGRAKPATEPATAERAGVEEPGAVARPHPGDAPVIGPRAPSPPPWLARPEGPSQRVRGAVGPGAPMRRPALAGGFVIDPKKCLVSPAMGGTSCAVCLERCPLPGAIVSDGGPPTIVAEVCDGCGLCVPGCPAPVLAIRWQPRVVA